MPTAETGSATSYLGTLQRRTDLEEFHNLLQELRLDEDRFQRYFGLVLWLVQFDDLLYHSGARITHQDTNYRRSIPAAKRLSICLRLNKPECLVWCLKTSHRAGNPVN
ncbi:hypothetical protein WMY93_030561 [Mugilogobius chulae]|uniref:Uncharacterized protein n=1 Tax=Mugilogobius chulae TaxID=88201 RepID=A0AAW0MD70_9GOBI